MRHFERVANDESDGSNIEMRADGAADDRVDRISHAEILRENEFSRRLIEQSLGRSGRALFSDANFLSGPLGRIISSDRPVFEAVGSDSGIDDLEVIDESNIA